MCLRFSLKEVYDWLGSMEQLPLFFSLRRPLGGAAIQHEENVVQSEKVFVHELVSTVLACFKSGNALYILLTFYFFLSYFQ